MQSNPPSYSYVNNEFSEPAEVFFFYSREKGRVGGVVNKHTTFRTTVYLKYINKPSYFSPRKVVHLTENTGHRGRRGSRGDG